MFPLASRLERERRQASRSRTVPHTSIPAACVALLVLICLFLGTNASRPIPEIPALVKGVEVPRMGMVKKPFMQLKDKKTLLLPQVQASTPPLHAHVSPARAAVAGPHKRPTTLLFQLKLCKDTSLLYLNTAISQNLLCKIENMLKMEMILSRCGRSSSGANSQSRSSPPLAPPSKVIPLPPTLCNLHPLMPP